MEGSWLRARNKWPLTLKEPFYPATRRRHLLDSSPSTSASMQGGPFTRWSRVQYPEHASPRSELPFLAKDSMTPIVTFAARSHGLRASACSSVSSLGATTDSLCELLGKPWVLRRRRAGLRDEPCARTRRQQSSQ